MLFFTRDGAQPKPLDLNPRSRFRSEFRAPALFPKKQSWASELLLRLRLNFAAQAQQCLILRSHTWGKCWWPWGLEVPPALQSSQVGWQGSQKCCTQKARDIRKCSLKISWGQLWPDPNLPKANTTSCHGLEEGALPKRIWGFFRWKFFERYRFQPHKKRNRAKFCFW